MRFEEKIVSLSADVHVSFHGNGIVTLRDEGASFTLGENETKKLVLAILDHRIASGQNNLGGRE